MKFLLGVVPHLLTVDHSTPPKDIIDAVKQKYGQEIALRQAQKVKSSLCPKSRQPSNPNANDGENRSAARRRRFRDSTATHGPTDATENTGMQLDTQDEQEPSSIGAGSLPRESRSSARHLHPIASAASLPDPSHNDTMPSARLPDNDSNGFHGFYVPQLASFNHRMAARVPNTRYTMSAGKTPQEVRNEAAVLFQRASEKFQEACFLHAEASRLFASVSNS